MDANAPTATVSFPLCNTRWKILAFVLVCMGVGPAVSSCSTTDENVVLSNDEQAKAKTLSPLPPLKGDPTNRYADDPAAAKLGQKLFFEPRLSGPILAEGAVDGVGRVGLEGERGKISCATCHQPGAWFQDSRSVPNSCTVAAGWTGRNTPPIVNAAFYDWFFWDGRADALWVQALAPLERGTEMNSSRLRVAHVVYENYRDEYNAVFDPDLDPDLNPTSANATRFPDSEKPPTDTASPWATMAPKEQEIINRIFTNVGKAMAAYERLLVSRNAPFDRFMAGDESAINTRAKLGLKLFVGKAACVACHSGPFLSDNHFHNTGVPQLQGDVAHVQKRDVGRFDGITQLQQNELNASSVFSDSPNARATSLTTSPADRGAFRTKGLREVGATGPFMHGGQLASLEEVVDLYNAGGGAPGSFDGTKDVLISPLNLTAEEKASLVEFLRSLTGEPIPADLMRDLH